MEITAEIWASFFTVTPGVAAISVGLAVALGCFMYLLNAVDVWGDWRDLGPLIQGAMYGFAITWILWLALLLSLFVVWVIGMVF